VSSAAAAWRCPGQFLNSEVIEIEIELIRGIREPARLRAHTVITMYYYCYLRFRVKKY